MKTYLGLIIFAILVIIAMVLGYKGTMLTQSVYMFCVSIYYFKKWYLFKSYGEEWGEWFVKVGVTIVFVILLISNLIHYLLNNVNGINIELFFR